MSWWRHRDLILVIIIISSLSSCSVFNRTDYNWAIYGGHPSHAPYGEVDLPDFQDSVAIELNFSPAFMIPTGQGVFLWDSMGSLYWLDYFNQNSVLVRAESMSVSAVLKKDNTIYTIYRNGLITADDAVQLDTRWTLLCSDSIYSTPVIYENNLAVKSPHYFWIIETNSGEIIFTDSTLNTTGCANLSLSLDGSRVFSGTNQGEIFCLDLKNQQMDWSYRSSYYFPIRATPIIVKDQVQVVYPNGILEVIDKDKGKLISEFQIEPIPDLNYFCFNKDVIYLSSYPVRKYLLAYSLSRKALLWKVSEVGGTFLLFKNKIIILSSNQLYSISIRGDQLTKWDITGPVYCFSYHQNQLLVGGENHLIIYK